MASNFDRWEKDPFFSAAEEVQESADRMESTYRTWIHSKKDSSGMWNSEELQRDLRTALGTTKWQLDEFERAVGSNYINSIVDDAKERHRQFIIAIECQISKIESSLHESPVSDAKSSVSWVHLDEGECHELEIFLSGPSTHMDKTSARIHVNAQLPANTQETDKQSTYKSSTNSRHSAEWNLADAVEEKLPGHRRTASASADIGSWKISVADDSFPLNSFNGHPGPPPSKVPSFSRLLNKMETASRMKWLKNGYRKLKNIDHPQEADNKFSQSQQLTRGINTCYEKSKSCLDDSSGCDDCYDKQLYGWYGAAQRLLQRSQYQMQYSRPIQVVFWIVLLSLIVLFALHAI